MSPDLRAERRRAEGPRDGSGAVKARLWERWRLWAAAPANRRVLGAVASIGGLTLLVHLATFVRELVVAREFGAGDKLDAFLIAFLLPSVAMTVIGGSFSPAFIPAYVRVREEQGDRAAQQLFADLVSLTALLLLGAAVVLALFFPRLLPLIATESGPDKLLLTKSLFVLLVPCLVLNGVATLWTAVLNARERFALGAITPVAVPLASVILILLLARTWGIFALAIGTVAGLFLQCLVLGIGLRQEGVRVHPGRLTLSPEVKQVFNQYLPMAAGALLLAGTTLVDQAMAAMLKAGSVAALSFGGKLPSFLIGLGALSVGTAALPHFSLLAAREEWQAVRRSAVAYTGLILVVTVPTVLVIMALSEPLVRLFFERGAFTRADTVLVARVQLLSVLQVPFYLVGTLFARLIASLQHSRVLLWGAGISLTLNIVLNRVLMRVLGVAGIALSTSAVYLVACVFLGLMLHRKLREREGQLVPVGAARP